MVGELSVKTPAAQLRREVEARTGTCQNMRQFGFRPVKYTLAGEPTRFSTGSVGRDQWWVVQRTRDKQWRVAQGYRTVRYPRERQVLPPLFPSPIAAAIWLQVEKENGNIRFAEG